MNQGNGSHCDDVDECQEQGGQHGHHCPTEHARCPDDCHHDDRQNHHQQLYCTIYIIQLLSQGLFSHCKAFQKLLSFALCAQDFFAYLYSIPIRAKQIEIFSIWYLNGAS